MVAKMATVAAIKITVLFLLFFLPFIVYPFQISPYEKPKVLAAEIAIQILVVTTLFVRKKIKATLNKKLLITLALIFSLSAYHLVTANSPNLLFGNPIRLQGTFLLWYLLALCAVSSLIPLPKIKNTIPVASLILTLLLATVLEKNINGRAVGTLGEPNALAATAIFLWVLPQKNAILKTISLAATLAIIFLSKSQSAVVAVLLQMLLFTNIKFFGLSKKLVVIIFILLVLSFSLPFFQESLYENRGRIWKVSLFAGFYNPIVGAGFGNGQHQIERAADYLGSPIRLNHIDSAHNFLLDWWIQGGIVGLLLIIFLSANAIFSMVKKRKTRELTALLGIVTMMSFNPASVITLVAFWWLLGQSFSKTS